MKEKSVFLSILFVSGVYILLRVEKFWLGTDNNLRGKVFFLHNHLVMQHSLQQQ